MNKGQPRFQDDRARIVRGWCGKCWFRLESVFDASLPESTIRAFFIRHHRAHTEHKKKPCTSYPRLSPFDDVKNPV